MLLRSPAEYFYKFLIVHPDRHDNAMIEQILLLRGIDWISAEYVNRLRARLRVPSPFYPKDEAHLPSFQFLCQEQLVQLFQPDKDARTMLGLLDIPRAREFVETMLLSHAPHEAIAKAVVRYGKPCTTKAVELYAHYFWNVNLLDSTEMKILLHWRFDKLHQVDAEGNEVHDGLASAGKKASYQDPRKLAAELPFSPFAAMLVQMRMGVMPSQTDIATRIVATRDMATMRALEVLHFATPGDASRAFNYSMVAKIMNEMLETVQKPDETLREQLSAIALRTEGHSLPSIHSLSKGRHTVDLEPTPEGTYEPKSMDEPGEGT